MEAQRGMRDKLDKYLDVGQEISVLMQVQGSVVYDFCCFGVDAANKLSDERYMVFYNQTRSPEGEISFQQNSTQPAQAEFRCQLSRLPQNIDKLVFTVSIDGAGLMQDIVSHTLSIQQKNQTVIHLALRGADFQQERAIISMELYRKENLWRFAALASGFNGGLGDLLRSYGGEELEGPVQQPSAPVSSISLEKKLEKAAPKLLSLAKPIRIELEKRNLLHCLAKVALILDISGSMSERYKNGTVQEIINKVLPLAVQFDNDGNLDFWYYGTTPKRMPAVTLQNYQEAVPENWKQLMKEVGGRNNEAPVIREVITEYKASKLPAYVVFITDGGVSSAKEIQNLLTDASRYPIFWQFVGVGGAKYGILERLDSMEGRFVDNANFFALDDFRTVSNSELYSRLLNEFPQWLQEIKRKGMLSL